MYSKHEKFLFILWMLFEFISAEPRSPQRTFRHLDLRPLFFAVASNLVRCVLRVAASLWHLVHCLRILIIFCASTLEDEICPIASKDKAIAKAKLIPLVFFCVSASHRRHVHHVPHLVHHVPHPACLQILFLCCKLGRFLVYL